jgi:L-lysine exporter family protein LysE/ArgO
MFDTASFVQGLVLGLGMFVCPGPKDVLILRQALLQRSSLELISVAVLSDVLLIWMGMAGASVALAHAPSVQVAALWLGVGLLVRHAAQSAKSAWEGVPDAVNAERTASSDSNRKGLTALFSASLLNPIAWLDTLLVIGAVGASLPSSAQMSFAAGASMASLAWFLFLVLGARQASRWMAHRNAARVLDAFVALAMSGMAVYIVVGWL